MAEMESRTDRCDLCALLWKAASENNAAQLGPVRFERDRSWIKLKGITRPVFTICCGRGQCNSPGFLFGRGPIPLTSCTDFNPRPMAEISYGLAELPKADSRPHFDLVERWLQFCDNNHVKCRTSTSQAIPGRMPTRLIDVGTAGDGQVRLKMTGEGCTARYVALSHPWGVGGGRHFVTNIENIWQHQKGIALEALPRTFLDAVITTRALGIRYLWIDSICIVQGPGGDFDVEAKNMELVFSSAYVVLAASRAHNQFEGFLGARLPRDYVALPSRGGQFYVCKFIDDFKGDVLESHLNKRGWVLQEHALARRTIFFAKTQTYFECGDGVRCETLTKMSKWVCSLPTVVLKN